MSDITLSCLIQGTSLDNYFKVTIGKNNDISDLKEIIWKKKQNTFSSIDANEIKLWKVSVPTNEKEKFDRLRRNESTVENLLNGVTIRDATDEIEEVFGSPVKKHIHVIIGLPTATARALNDEIQNLAQQTRAMNLQGM
jgi:hypothetical protein